MEDKRQVSKDWGEAVSISWESGGGQRVAGNWGGGGGLV